MKLDRLLSIITILLQNEKVTAPELAEKLEVSRRTVHRDIDAICQAGIPIVTFQGGGGGIRIADGFKLDKSILTYNELQSIVAGLKSLGSVSDTTGIERLISRLSPGGDAVVSLKESILIDLSSHYKESLSEKIGLIKSAIARNRLIGFIYYSEKGKTARMVEPVYLSFKWSAWYVFGFCRSSGDFRLFKLNRLWELKVLDEQFASREIPVERQDLDTFFQDELKVTILFDKELEYLLVDSYGPGSYEVLADGRLKAIISYTRRDNIIGWILSMGEKAEVLDPRDMADEIRVRAKKIVSRYEHDR